MVFAATVSSAAIAQVEPVPTANDPGLRDLSYSQSQPMRLPVARGGALRVTFAGDEAVQSVSVGAPINWKVDIRTPSDLTVRSVGGTTDSTLSVLTDKRSYNFVLTLVPPTRAPYLVRMNYATVPPPAAGTTPPPEPVHGRYRLSGNPELRPSAMTDDGSKTYIEWRADQAIPAVFALDGVKREEMVNGYMRDDVFTIDRIYDRLVFRIDRAAATATKLKIKKPR